MPKLSETINALTEDVSPDAANDFVVIYDASGSTSKKVALDNLPSNGIGGATGSTDNAVPRADGTGGSTLQASGVTIDDSDNIDTSGDITAANLTPDNPIAHEYGGLEADVSAYSGLVKIDSGSTSAVTAPSGDIVGTSDTQTLTNKTLDADNNTVSNIGSAEVKAELITGLTADASPDGSSDYVMTFDDSASALKKVLLEDLPGGGGSSLPVDDTTALVQDPADNTKQMRIDVGGLTTSTTRVATMPDADVTLGTDSSAIHDNVAGEISALTEKGSPASGDHILIEDSADSNNKKRIQIGNLPTGSGISSFDIDADTGTAETVDDGNTITFTGGTGIDTSVGATDTITIAIDSTVATLSGAQTLTNKTIDADNNTITNLDASDIAYTPTTATDWDGDADPGDLDDALDQLAERVDDLEGESSTESLAENTRINEIDQRQTLLGIAGLLKTASDLTTTDITNPAIDVGATNDSDESIREIGNFLYTPWDSERPYKTWYTGYDAGANTDEKIHYAYSKDGKSWTKYASNPVISVRSEDPYVVYKDGTYYLFCEAKATQDTTWDVRRYSSTDGITWTDDGLCTGFSSTGQSSPVVWIEGDTWYMLYEQGATGDQDIRLATSSNGLAFTDDGSNPVFTGAEVTWDTTPDVVPDDIIRIGDTYYMSYHSAGGNYGSAIAYSTNLTSWTDVGLELTDGTANALGHVQFLWDGKKFACFIWWALDDTNGIERFFLDNPIVTISSGAVTIESEFAYVAAESGTSDDLATINGVAHGQSVIIRADSGDTITVKHGTGNIYLNGAADFALSGNKSLQLWNWGGVLTDIGAGGGSGGSSPLTTKGDIYTYTTVDARLPVGTNGQILSADSSESTGLKWIDNSGGGGGASATRTTSTLLWKKTLGSAGNLDTNDTPDVGSTDLSGYDHLHIIIRARSDVSATGDGSRFYVNNDTTDTNYRGTLAESQVEFPSVSTIPGATATAGEFNVVEIFIPNYASTTYRKQMRFDNSFRQDATNQYRVEGSVNWESTAAITRVAFMTDNDPTDELLANSVMEVYGIKQESIGVTTFLETSSADVSNPPTDAELDSEFGTPASVGNGFAALLDDNGGDTNVYAVFSNGTSWFYTALTKAT